jgi:hypothetical protein
MKLFISIFLYIFTFTCSEATTWNRILIPGGAFVMIGYAPSDLVFTDTLNIFIEGDGEPGIALKLAQNTGGNSIYIARPCQFIQSKTSSLCNKDIWTSHRYSQNVIDSMNRAITAMKLRYKAREIRLIGFSGGGAIASIVASKRSDIALLLTVAGNLDHKRWTDYNNSASLDGSLNPIDYSSGLEKISQIHLIGDRDQIVPGSVLSSYLSHFKKLDNVHSYIIQGADHTCCWSLAVSSVLLNR